MPTLRPRSRSAEREIDRGGRFADAALAGGDRDDRADARNAGGRPRGRCPCPPVPRGARGAGVRLPAVAADAAARAAGAFGGERDHDRLHAGNRAHRRFGALAHVFPGLDLRAASTVIEKNTLPSVATISDSFPVAGERRAVGRATAASFARTSSLSDAMPPSPCRSMPHCGHDRTARPRSTRPVDAPPPVMAIDRWRRARAASTMEDNDGEGGVCRAWRHGLPDGRASQDQGRPRRHGLSTAPPPKPRNGSRNMAAKARRRRRRRPRARTSSWPASATTTICAR